MNAKQLFSLVLVALSLISCRNDHSEDTHDHEEINKITITITEAGTTNTQTVSYQTGSGASAAINLQNGKTYNVNMAFYHQDGTSSKDLTKEVITEKDQHFILYQFAGVGVNITRATDDIVRTDGKKLGLKTTWAVTSAPVSGSSIIKLIHNPTSIDDLANNGAGNVTGGEADVNAVFVVN